MISVWNQLLSLLEHSLSNEDFIAWIAPLQVGTKLKNGKLILTANNKFIKEKIDTDFSTQIQTAIDSLAIKKITGFIVNQQKLKPTFETIKSTKFNSNLNSDYHFGNFVEGKSNQIALAAAKQIAESPGSSYNPLFIYGATGLGKSHLMHSIGHLIKKTSKEKVLYLRSETFVRDMITAIKNNNMNKFKDFYQSIDVLLMDDVQFLAGKDRSEEEFFLCFNYLLEGNNQVVLTSDQYPKEINNLKDRLKSRFSSGLIALIDPPEYETRVGILNSKAKELKINLSETVVFFIAELVQSNARELQGALNSVIALTKLTNAAPTLEITKKALMPLLNVQSKIHSIDNIQQTIIRYFNISLADLVSKSRSRSIVRPRQIAMSLISKLTKHSLPEIGKAFGGRDHTTVIHACKQIKILKTQDAMIEEHYKKLLRLLSV